MTGQLEQVGRVLGSQHTSTSAFRVVLDDDDYLQLDDLVVVRTQVPKAGEVRTYGVVTEAEAVYEGASYESDTHRIAGWASCRGRRSAPPRCRSPASSRRWVSPDPGETVERAVGDERAKALYVDEMGRPLAVGIGRDEQPVHIDLDFFDGRKGGHMSISGVSGIATKTSFALFFLRMLSAREHGARRGRSGQPARARVQREGRGPALARPAEREFNDEAREGWAALGVEPTPFPSVAFWAPPKRRSGEVVVPDTGGRFDGIEVFSWTRASSSTTTCCNSASPTRTTRTRSRSSGNGCRSSSSASR